MTDAERPTILLHAHEAITGGQLRELLLGIEEEGVPVTLQRLPELNPLVLAHGAGTASRLGVGVGVSLDYVVVTTEKLPASRPYIAQFLGAGAARDRAIGANAARLVKRMPLSPMTEPA